MGRMRYKSWSNDYLNKSEIFIKNLDSLKNNWNKQVFKNNNEIFLEIGNGKGDFIFNNSIENKDINYLGLEKNISIQAIAIKKIENNNKEIPKNLRFILYDANNINSIFGNNEISRIYINFPDPWPKDRHNKRRLLHSDFFERYKKILKKNGIIEIRTDQEFLFKDVINDKKILTNFEVIESSKNFHNNKLIKIRTEYEKKFINNNKKIFYIKLKII